MNTVVILEQAEWKRINRVLVKANEIRLDADKGEYAGNIDVLLFAVGSLCRAVEKWANGTDDEPEDGPRDD